MPERDYRPLLATSTGMADLPIRTFAHLPTTVEEVALKGGFKFWIKRDDQSHPTYGGNKTRKLEFLMGEALSRECNSVATMGGIGTNHGLATAIFAQDAGLKCHLALFPQPVTSHVLQNLKLYHAHGAQLHLFGSFPGAAMFLAARAAADRVGRSDERLMVFGPGGSSPLGTLGFVNAALELAEQIKAGELPEPARIYCPLGSNGTLAGLTLGVRLAGLQSQVIGVRVTPLVGANSLFVAGLANKTLALLQRRGAAQGVSRLSPGDITIDHSFYGGTYGLPTAEGKEALAIADDAGIGLEPTYTAKTFAALLTDLRDPSKEGPVLYWNTFSSADLSHLANSTSPADLPPAFQPFFANP
jgi:1-aminocyclopropane-1-carboxylate deaminase/D-cysteine desulfhydrase-like pyridoxal-dependent ACC family enzyme